MLFLFAMLYSMSHGWNPTTGDATDIAIVSFSALSGLFLFGLVAWFAMQDEGWGRVVVSGLAILLLLGGGILAASAVICIVAIAIVCALFILPVLGGWKLAERIGS